MNKGKHEGPTVKERLEVSEEAREALRLTQNTKRLPTMKR